MDAPTPSVAVNDRVADEELLYRPFRRDELKKDQDGVIVGLSSQSFTDRDLQPSVDRAILLDSAQDSLDMQPDSVGVAAIRAYSVRQLSPISQYEADGKTVKQNYIVDVKPDELPTNHAHALIYLSPVNNNRKVFGRLLERLAREADIILMKRDYPNHTP